MKKRGQTDGTYGFKDIVDKITSTTSSASSPSLNNNKSKKIVSIFIILGIITVLALISATLVFYFNSNKDNNNNTLSLPNDTNNPDNNINDSNINNSEINNQLTNTLSTTNKTNSTIRTGGGGGSGSGTGTTCTPQCSGKECGDDTCGGSCGACGSSLGYFCNSSFICELNDTIIPDFLNISDNSPSNDSDDSIFNITINNSNGTVILLLSGENYIAQKNSDNDYGIIINNLSSGDYNYNWKTFGADASNKEIISSTRVYKKVGPDKIYPIFSYIQDNSGSLVESGIARFNSSVTNTNGTVNLIFNGVKYLASFLNNKYSVNVNINIPGNNSYYWSAYGNGTKNNINISSPENYIVNTDNLYPYFTNYFDNNNTLIDSGIAVFNVSVTNSNGTVGISFNGQNFSATNTLGNNYYFSRFVSGGGEYNYYWYSYGNGIAHKYNNSIFRKYFVKSGCIPSKICSDYPQQCGSTLFDGCNNVLNCSDNCQSGYHCDNGTCLVDVCTPSRTCNYYSGQCGTSLSNGCNNVLNCSNNCGSSETCSNEICVGPSDPIMPLTFDVPYVLPTGGTNYTPLNGPQLQIALDSAVPGDIIILQAGTIYKGTFILPPQKPNPINKWVYVISSDMVNLPVEGDRIVPSRDASFMPKLSFPDVWNANIWLLATNANSSYWRFSGIEFVHEATGDYPWVGVMISLGSIDYNPQYPNSHTEGYWTQVTKETDLPHHIVFDRCYLHSNLPYDYSIDNESSQATSRFLSTGIQMSGNYIASIDSYFENIQRGQEEAYAIHLYQGDGPYKIVNNYLEATGQNFFSGGADPKIIGSIPSDIEFRNNYVYKNPNWKMENRFFTVKALMELKNAQRIFIDGNIFDTNYGNTGSLYGEGIVITPRNQAGNAPWSKITDVTFTNNIIKNVPAAMQILSSDYNFNNPTSPRYSPDTRLLRLKVKNNALINLDYTVTPLLYGQHSPASGIGFSNGYLPAHDWFFENNLILPGPDIDSGKFAFSGWVGRNRVLPWESSTLYTYYSNGGFDWYGVVVSYNGDTYMAQSTHTSTNDFNSDLASGKWAKMPDDTDYYINNFTFKNNLFAMGNYGFSGNNLGRGMIVMTTHFKNWSFMNNGFIIRPSDAAYLYYKNEAPQWISEYDTLPMNSILIDEMSNVGFTDYQNGNFTLSIVSPYKNAGTDGKDIGPDWNILNDRIKCTQDGQCAQFGNLYSMSISSSESSKDVSTSKKNIKNSSSPTYTMNPMLGLVNHIRQIFGLDPIY